MKEYTVAIRYHQSADFRWNNTIQLIRDTFVWDKDEGFTMGGTWEGLLPENGLYQFEPHSKVRFSTSKENVLKGKDVLMFVTFNTDGTWQANDYWYNEKVNGTFTDTPGVKTTDIAGFFHYAFIGNARWYTIGGYDLSDNHASNQISYDFPAFTPPSALLDVTNNDYYGFGAMYGGRLFIGRSINYRYKQDYKLYNLNGANLDGANIQHNEVMNRRSIGFTRNNDRTISYRATYVSSGLGNTSQTSEIGKTTPGFRPNRHAWSDLFRPDGRERYDFAANLEGSMTDFDNGFDRNKPITSKVTLNAIYEPWCGFPTTKVISGFNPGVMFHPKRIDFYEGTTELFSVNYNANKDN